MNAIRNGLKVSERASSITANAFYASEYILAKYKRTIEWGRNLVLLSNSVCKLKNGLYLARVMLHLSAAAAQCWLRIHILLSLKCNSIYMIMWSVWLLSFMQRSIIIIVIVICWTDAGKNHRLTNSSNSLNRICILFLMKCCECRLPFFFIFEIEMCSRRLKSSWNKSSYYRYHKIRS